MELDSAKNNLTIRRVLLISLSVFLIIEGVFFSWAYVTESLKIYQFGGNIERVDGNIIYASGIIFDGDKIISGNDENAISVEINVPEGIVIKRIAINIPSGLKSFKIDDLKKDESEVSLAAINSDINSGHILGIEAKLKKNIFYFYNKKLTATYVEYRVPIFNTK